MPDNAVDLETLRRQFVGRRTGPFVAWNPVSETHLWQWRRALGDDCPLYAGDEALAPPTMLQMWTFRDANGRYAPGSTDDDCFEVLKRFDEAGFSGVVAVSYDQTYHRYLKVGDHITSYSTIESISDHKATALGNGYFVSEHAEYFDLGGERVGEARVTYFKYQPPEQRPSAGTSPRKIQRIAPVENHDSKHYWQGLREGKLLIQFCADCDTPRHPPQPMCERCQSVDWEARESCGHGTIHSYTVLHYPEIPPFDYPNALVLVDLDEGVRLASQLVDASADDLAIGRPVAMEIREVQDGLSLPLFRPVS